MIASVFPTLDGILQAVTPLAEAQTGIALDSRQFWGIPLALIGAAFMSFGAQYQSRGLNKVEIITGKSAGAGLSFQHIISLLRRPSWVIGTILLALAVVFQIMSLSLAPLTVVQPIGVVALVITAVLNSRMTGVKLPRHAITSLAMCVGGIVIFVTVASFTTADRPVTDQKLIIILILFAVVFVAALFFFALLRHRAIALFYIIGAGVLYGFVATFAKTVLGRLQQGEFEWLTWACVLALVIGALFGMVFVQNAYSSGPPDLVIAGLTVVDPLIAVLIGIVVLNEAANASLWAVLAFIVAGLVSLIGVVGLAKYHPQTGQSAFEEHANTGAVPSAEN